MDPKLIKSFQKQYGVKVRVANFDSMSSMMAKLRSGNQYDLIFPTADYVNRLIKANMLLQLDRDKLKNADGIYDFFDEPWYDAGSAHTVPYAMYTTGIAWRVDKMGELTGSWNDLAMEKAKGKTFMLDDFQEGIGQANLLNGFDLNTTDPAELEKTKATLEHQKEYLRGYSTNASPQLLSGTAWVHHALERRHRLHAQPGEEPGELQVRDLQGGHPGRLGLHGDPVEREVAGHGAPVHRLDAQRRARRAERRPTSATRCRSRAPRRRSRSSSRTTRRSRSRRTTSRTEPVQGAHARRQEAVGPGLD